MFVDGIASSSMFSRPMKMEIVPCAHPINCDTNFDPHVAELLQLCVSEGVWHEEDGRNNSGADNLSNSDNDNDTQHDWFSDDDLSSCEGESSLYVINVGTRGSVSIPRCQTESLSCALVACAVRLCERSGDCLLYTSPSPRDGLLSRMPSSA